VRPAQVEVPVEIAERQNDAIRRVGSERDVEASIHAGEHDDGGGMLREVAAARQLCLRTLEFLGVATGTINHPVNALPYRDVMNLHGIPASLRLWRFHCYACWKNTPIWV
jgi:hypothetical protein